MRGYFLHSATSNGSLAIWGFFENNARFRLHLLPADRRFPPDSHARAHPGRRFCGFPRRDRLLRAAHDHAGIAESAVYHCGLPELLRRLVARPLFAQALGIREIAWRVLSQNGDHLLPRGRHRDFAAEDRYRELDPTKAQEI